ncbi:MAG TPA: hypothetical protein VGD98_01140 [Ktedonobacteraceae bacterium]
MSKHTSNPTQSILLRGILNSCGNLSVEAELVLADGSWGRAAVPIAIKPGRREKPRSRQLAPGRFVSASEISQLTSVLREEGGEAQEDFDRVLSQHPLCQDLGSDITLALSLAFARASATARDLSLTRYLASSGPFQPRVPHPLINLFSGGIHGQERTVPFQQIMLVPRYATFYEDIAVALQIYQELEQSMRASGRLLGYSASSGMLVKTSHYQVLLAEVAEHIARLPGSASIGIGLDVAAEHLKRDQDHYQFAETLVSSTDLLALYQQLLSTLPLTYLEDPFDADDSASWRALKSNVGDALCLVGDDLFATNACYLDQQLAHGILLKMNQSGTLSGTLAATRAARLRGMTCCVSHRSCETEDTAMCDLAVAIGADYIKIGGPRRGDRIVHYNQLLRLAEEWQHTE